MRFQTSTTRLYSFFMAKNISIFAWKHGEWGQRMCEENRYTNWIWSRKLRTNNEKVHIYCSWNVHFFLSVFPILIVSNALGLILVRLSHNGWDLGWRCWKIARSWGRNRLHVIQIVLCESNAMQWTCNLFKSIGYTISRLIHVLHCTWNNTIVCECSKAKTFNHLFKKKKANDVMLYSILRFFSLL